MRRVLTFTTHRCTRRTTALVLILVSVLASAAGSGGINAPEHRDKPYLVLISIDGFRWDYQDLHDTPTLDRIADAGIRADALIPVFPTLTFPNHYSIATGLYPANHGIIGNTFPDAVRRDWYSIRDRATVEHGDWYRGEPIWVTAERNGMVTAAFFFVGTEADIGGQCESDSVHKERCGGGKIKPLRRGGVGCAQKQKSLS